MKKLENKSSAIGFKKKDYLGKNIDFSDYKGKKVLLSFFRGSSCAFCNLRINRLVNKYSEFEKNKISIITFFAASQNDIVQYAGKQKAPFPIIPDPDLEIYKKYGIEESYLGMANMMLKPFEMINVMVKGYFNLKSIQDKPIIPADFLIDENHNIYRAYYGKDFSDHLSIEEILNWKK